MVYIFSIDEEKVMEMKFCFVRFVALYKSQNNEVKFHLVFVRFLAFHKAPKRTNDMAESGFHIK